VAALGVPVLSRAQADVIRIGHLTPRTGFLGPLGEFRGAGADMAVAEINAAGGVSGRKIELLKEDSVNPQTASTKAERMIERDKVACIIGEISSASGLTISQVAERTRTLFINTGCNSDELRGKGCKKFMFHIESQNSMYVKTCGRSLMAQGPGQGQEVVLADRRLRLRPRSAARREALHVGQRRRLRGRQARSHGRHRFLAAAARDPQCQARPGDLQPGRQPDHQLPEAVLGIRTVLSRLRGSASTPRSHGPRGAETSWARGRWCGTT
jgi:hypothetical protein